MAQSPLQTKTHRLAAPTAADITEAEVLEAQGAWAEAITSISAVYMPV